MNGLQNEQLNKAYVNQLLVLNEESSKKGLVLTQEDAKHILQARSQTLNSYGRIELGLNVTEEIIQLFQQSDFVNPDNYVTVLTEIQEIFYYFKNETNEKVGDKDLLNKIKYYYEIECGGAIQLLKSKMEEYARKVRVEHMKQDMENEGRDIFERKGK